MKKEQQVLIAIGIGVIFILFLYFKFLLIPINKRISDTRDEITKKQKKLVEAKALASTLPNLKQYIEILKQYVVELEKKVPVKPDIPELIKIISKESQNYNVKVTNIIVGDMGTSAKEFNEIPFTINFNTNFHDFAQFLTNIAQGKRLFSALNVTLNYAPAEKLNLRGSCIIVAYTLKQSLEQEIR